MQGHFFALTPRKSRRNAWVHRRLWQYERWHFYCRKWSKWAEMTWKRPKRKTVKPLELQSFTISCGILQVYAILPWVPKRGLGKASVTSFPARVSRKIIKPPGAKSGTFSDASPDSRLQALIAHWANLPETLRESIFRQVCETLILQNLPSNDERIQSWRNGMTIKHNSLFPVRT